MSSSHDFLSVSWQKWAQARKLPEKGLFQYSLTNAAEAGVEFENIFDLKKIQTIILITFLSCSTKSNLSWKFQPTVSGREI